MKHWLTGSLLGWLLLSCLLFAIPLPLFSSDEGAWGLVWRWLGLSLALVRRWEDDSALDPQPFSLCELGVCFFVFT